MNWKVIFLILTMLLIINQSFAQRRYRHASYRAIDFFHEIGGSAFFVSTPYNNATMPAFTYSPRLSFDLNRISSISFSAPVSIFPNYHTQNEIGRRQIKFGYEIPVSVDLNIGLGSTSRCREDLGCFFGAGFGISEVSVSDLESSGSQDSKVAGKYVQAGLRLPTQKKHMYSFSVYTIWGSFNRKIFGLRALYSLYKF